MPPPSSSLRFGRSVALFWDFVGTVLAGAVAGWFIDRQFGVEPYGIVAMMLIGVGGGFVRLVRELQRLDRQDRGR